MSTNYYVELAIGGTLENGPFKIEQPELKIKWHIGKNLTMFQGSVFNSWAAWKHFLWENRHGITIRDESGVEYWAGTFIEMVEKTDPSDRRRQYDWVIKNTNRTDVDWLCADGFSFCKAEFF